MTIAQPLLEIRDLSVVYPTRRGDVRAVDSIFLRLDPGSKIGIVGESGCGKSSVLHAILRLIRKPGKVSCGDILFKGHDLAQLSMKEMRKLRGKEISMIFQDPQTTLNPVFQVGEQIRESLQIHHIIPGKSWPLFFGNAHRRLQRERVFQAMSEVGIPSPADRYWAYPHQFSGGMQQRALIAMALACGPSLLLADEPTTALDVTIQAQILDLMRQINQEHHTAVILVTHDLGVAAEFCDTIAVMYAGRIVEQGPVDEVVTQPQHPYSRGLLACRPRISDKGKKIQPIPGNVPDIVDLPNGCAFSPRCPLARPICNEGPVPMFQTSEISFSRCLALVNFERIPTWSWEHIVRV